jgi:hypothetical protein
MIVITLADPNNEHGHYKAPHSVHHEGNRHDSLNRIRDPVGPKTLDPTSIWPYF